MAVAVCEERINRGRKEQQGEAKVGQRREAEYPFNAFGRRDRQLENTVLLSGVAKWGLEPCLFQKRFRQP